MSNKDLQHYLIGKHVTVYFPDEVESFMTGTVTRVFGKVFVIRGDKHHRENLIPWTAIETIVVSPPS